MKFIKTIGTTHYLVLFALFFPVSLFSQQTIIHGNVSIFNSRTDSGVKKYVSNATIDDEFGRAQQANTDVDGNFELFCYLVKEGNAVSLRVIKSGLEVVNIASLQAIAEQKEVVRISMAKPNMIAEYRKKLYQIGKTESEKRLVAETKIFKDSISHLQQRAGNNQDRIAFLERKIDTLQQRQGDVENFAIEFVRRYGSIDLDYASPLFMRAFDLFKEGKVDSALHMLEDANLPDMADKIIHEDDSLREEELKIHRKRTIDKMKLTDVSEALRLKGDLHITKLEYDSAFLDYRYLIKIEPTNEKNLFQYAFLLYHVNETDSSLKYYRLVLQVTHDSVVRSGVLNNMADLLERKEDYVGSIQALLEAFSIRKAMYLRYPKLRIDYANTLNNLGGYYDRRNKYDSAEYYFINALQNYDTNITRNLQETIRARMKTKANLGALYGKMDRPAEAIRYLVSALEDEKRLVGASTNEYDPGAISISLFLAGIYMNISDYANGSKILNTALDQYFKLSPERQLSLRSQYARIEYNLGVLAEGNGYFTSAKEHLLKSYTIRKEFAKRRPESFDADYILVLTELGKTYRCLNVTDSAEILLIEGLKTIQKHRQVRSDAFAVERIRILNILAILLMEKKMYQPSIKYCIEFVNVCENLREHEHDAYQFETLQALYLLGTNYYYNDQLDSAISVYKRSAELISFMPIINKTMVVESIEQLGCYNSIFCLVKNNYAISGMPHKYPNSNLKKFGPGLGLSLMNLGNLCMRRQPVVGSTYILKYFSQAFDLYTRLEVVYPRIYDSVRVLSKFYMALALDDMGKIKEAKVAYLDAIMMSKGDAHKRSKFFSDIIKQSENRVQLLELLMIQ